MNARFLATFLCLASLSTGCIIVDHHDDGDCCDTPTPTGQPGDVTFLWTIVNGRCADAPEVKNIQITIPGETLHNGGIYDCNTAGVDGIVLHDFVPGTYTYTIKARDYSNYVVYEASGRFTVNGDVRESIDLTPGGKTYALISWYFPPNTSSSNPTCGQAGVTSMKASFDSGEWLSVNCVDGTIDGGLPSPFLEPGAHSLSLVAYGDDTAGHVGMPLYTSQGTFTTVSGHPISASFRFDVVGGASVRWDIWDGYEYKYKSCAEAGLTGVRINFKDTATGQFVYPDGDPQSCSGAPILYQFLKPGTYEVYVRGMSGSSVVYTNEGKTPKTTVTVRPFVQVTKSDPVSADLIIEKI